jgi:hypothetical protein
MAESERTIRDHPSAAWFRQDLEKIQGDLLAVLRHHWPNVGHQLIAHALIETTGTVLAAIAAAEPAALADIDRKLDELQTFVVTTAQPTQ